MNKEDITKIQILQISDFQGYEMRVFVDYSQDI